MSGDLVVVIDLGDGTKYAKLWNYNGTSYEIWRSTPKQLHPSNRHEARLVERILALEKENASRDAEIERLKAEAEVLKARWEIDNKIELELRALVEQLAGALYEVRQYGMEGSAIEPCWCSRCRNMDNDPHSEWCQQCRAALAAAAAYRKEGG